MIFWQLYDPQKPFKNQHVLLKLNTFGLQKMLVDIKLRCMQNSGHGGPHKIPFMTIFGIYVNPPIPNIEKNQAYEAYKSREVSHLLAHQISFRMPPESCPGTNFRPQL